MMGAILGDVVGAAREGGGVQFTDNTVMTLAAAEALPGLSEGADAAAGKRALVRFLHR